MPAAAALREPELDAWSLFCPFPPGPWTQDLLARTRPLVEAEAARLSPCTPWRCEAALDFPTLHRAVGDGLLSEPDAVLACLGFALSVRCSRGQALCVVRPSVDTATVPDLRAFATAAGSTPALVRLEGVVVAVSQHDTPTELLLRCTRCGAEERCVRYAGCLRQPESCGGCGGTSFSQLACVRAVAVSAVLRTFDGCGAVQSHALRAAGPCAAPLQVGQGLRVVGIARPGPPAGVCVISARPLPHGCPAPPSDREGELRRLVQANRPSMLHLLANSAFPGVVGHGLVKCCLLLALVGGCTRANAGQLYRGEISVLLVGDRATGKTSFLRSTASAVHRGHYVSCRDPLLLQPCVDAQGVACPGTAGEAHEGCLCVDDLGAAKPAVQRCLVQVCGSGELRLDTAAGHAMVPCGGTVIAAASRGAGVAAPSRHDACFSRLCPALLQGFDIAVPVADTRDDREDADIAAFVMDAYTAGQARGMRSETASQNTRAISIVSHDPRLPLHRRLEVDRAEFEPMPVELVRQLLALTRGVSPRFSEEGAAALSAFCRRLRQREEAQHGGAGADLGGAVDERFASTLVRLSQARARIELSSVVTRQHILDAMELLLELRSAASGRHDKVAALKPGRRGGATKKQALALLRALTRSRCADSMTLSELQSLGSAAGLDREGTECALQKLRDEGAVIKTASGTFRVLHGD